jgi:hypothetical protein
MVPYEKPSLTHSRQKRNRKRERKTALQCLIVDIPREIQKRQGTRPTNLVVVFLFSFPFPIAPVHSYELVRKLFFLRSCSFLSYANIFSSLERMREAVSL